MAWVLKSLHASGSELLLRGDDDRPLTFASEDEALLALVALGDAFSAIAPGCTFVAFESAIEAPTAAEQMIHDPSDGGVVWRTVRDIRAEACSVRGTVSIDGATRTVQRLQPDLWRLLNEGEQ